MLPARQIERMKDLAKALRHAGKLAQKAIQDEVGDHLLRGWCIESKVTPPPLSLDRMVDQVTKAVVGLGKLESAAIAGSRGLRPKSGRQRGTGVLSFHETLALWRVYRSSTGQDPRLEAGPFADFAQTFLVAVGKQKETENDYVVEHFKYLRKQHRKEALRRALSRASTDRTQLGE